MSDKQIDTVVTTAKYNGDSKAVANEAKKPKMPDNPDEIIANNTRKVIMADRDHKDCE